MKNSSLENRLKKLAGMIPKNNTNLTFDISKITGDELAQLSNMLKRIRVVSSKSTEFDMTKLTPDEITFIRNLPLKI